MGSNIDIRKVDGKADLKTFIALTRDIYKNDPHFIQPLAIERLDVLSPDKNPWFQHGEACYWIAWRGDKPVGRISAQIDQLSLEKIDPDLGHFGLFECFDDDEVADALLTTATDWLKSKGMTAMSGPYNLSINEECGLLVDGFNDPPMIMMGHARPYYQRMVEARGFEKQKDLYAYFVTALVPWPDKFLRVIALAERNKAINIRPIDMKNYEAELDVVFDIFNDAWSDNWGFLPFTKNEGLHAAKSLKPLIKPHRAMIAEYDGKPAAFMVCIPDINTHIRDLDGRLFPFGWIKLLWRMLRDDEHVVRVPLLGIKKDYQSTKHGALMAILLINLIRVNIEKNGGAQRAELGWILEDNMPMRNILEQAGAKIYKTYRIYRREI